MDKKDSDPPEDKPKRLSFSSKRRSSTNPQPEPETSDADVDTDDTDDSEPPELTPSLIKPRYSTFWSAKPVKSKYSFAKRSSQESIKAPDDTEFGGRQRLDSDKPDPWKKFDVYRQKPGISKIPDPEPSPTQKRDSEDARRDSQDTRRGDEDTKRASIVKDEEPKHVKEEPKPKPAKEEPKPKSVKEEPKPKPPPPVVKAKPKPQPKLKPKPVVVPDEIFYRESGPFHELEAELCASDTDVSWETTSSYNSDALDEEITEITEILEEYGFELRVNVLPIPKEPCYDENGKKIKCQEVEVILEEMEPPPALEETEEEKMVREKEEQRQREEEEYINSSVFDDEFLNREYLEDFLYDRQVEFDLAHPEIAERLEQEAEERRQKRALELSILQEEAYLKKFGRPMEEEIDDREPFIFDFDELKEGQLPEDILGDSSSDGDDDDLDSDYGKDKGDGKRIDSNVGGGMIQFPDDLDEVRERNWDPPTAPPVVPKLRPPRQVKPPKGKQEKGKKKCNLLNMLTHDEVADCFDIDTGRLRNKIYRPEVYLEAFQFLELEEILNYECNEQREFNEQEYRIERYCVICKKVVVPIVDIVPTDKFPEPRELFDTEDMPCWLLFFKLIFSIPFFRRKKRKPKKVVHKIEEQVDEDEYLQEAKDIPWFQRRYLLTCPDCGVEMVQAVYKD